MNKHMTQNRKNAAKALIGLAYTWADYDTDLSDILFAVVDASTLGKPIHKPIVANDLYVEVFNSVKAALRNDAERQEDELRSNG